MTLEQFLAARRPAWAALADLVARAKKRLASLTPADVEQLSDLYRDATSDLALAQRDFPRDRVTVYLNQLVGDAHAVIYQAQPVPFHRLRHFVAVAFPTTFRAAGRYILLAAALLFIPMILAGLATYIEPDSSRWLLDPATRDNLLPLIENQSLWVDIAPEERPGASSFIMTNNIRVAFLTFAGGILAGLLTVYVLVFNGVSLGAIMGLTYHYGVGLDLTEFVVGHGVIELSVIAFAGGAGLMLGGALLRPGLVSRSAAVQSAAQRALILLLGCVPLLVIAGVIEGFISPNEGLPLAAKAAVGLGSGGLMYFYLLRAGRTPTADGVGR